MPTVDVAVDVGARVASPSPDVLEAAVTAKPKPGGGRPDFTTNAKYERLVPLFRKTSLAELNDKTLRISDFQAKASELVLLKTRKVKMPGAFKSWSAAVEACLEYLSMPDAPTDTAGEETGDGAHAAGAAIEEQAEEDVDGEVEEALSVVEALLDGENVEACKPEDAHEVMNPPASTHHLFLTGEQFEAAYGDDGVDEDGDAAAAPSSSQPSSSQPVRARRTP